MEKKLERIRGRKIIGGRYRGPGWSHMLQPKHLRKCPGPGPGPSPDLIPMAEVLEPK